MDAKVKARAGYGMLALAIFGDYGLRQRSGIDRMVREYKDAHPKSRCVMGTDASVERIYKWYARQVISRITLPDEFIAAISEEVRNLDSRLHDPLYRQVLEMKYGLTDGVEKARKEIAQEIDNKKTGKKGVSRSRVDALERKAVLRLRHPSSSSKIKASLTDKQLRYLFDFELLDEESA